MTEPACWRPVAFRRRLLLTVLVAGQTLLGLWLFAGTLPDVSQSWPVGALLAVFAVLFAWIGVGFWTAVFGFVMLRRGGDRWALTGAGARPAGPQGALPATAVVMPICHEPVQRTLAGLRAIYRDLEHQGQSDAVDFYVLSDSQDPEVWLAEQAACGQLCDELDAHGRLFYRRRTVNLNHKSGNIADFLRRWGRLYQYMIVLDADSLLTGACIRRLVGLMEARPQAGIIQTAPRLARAETRFARLQQFANRCYGRLFAAGLAAIQLGEAAYWGHNAIIRVAPFMRHCGLRRLRGPGLFRGAVLSHDFVEAALMGRAGYEVWLEPAIAGSFEESPPTLADDLRRDRRWCRGNLQHLWLLFTLGRVRFAHRMALATGIIAYLASPLWLVFLALSGYVAATASEAPPPLPGMLAGGDAGTASGAALIAITAGLLFGPRLLALADQHLAGRVGGFGGTWRLGISTLTETALALVLAPVRMLCHSGHVLGAVLNINVSWQGQNRAGNPGLASGWATLLLPIAAAAGGLALVQAHAPALTPWALPVAMPMLLIPFLIRWLDQPFPKTRWLAVPEHSRASELFANADGGPPLARRWPGLGWVEQVVLVPDQPRFSVGRQRAMTGRKGAVLEALVQRCAGLGPQALSHRELSLLCSHPGALAQLHQRAWAAAPGTPWHAVLDRLARAVQSPVDASPERPPVVSEAWLCIDAAS